MTYFRNSVVQERIRSFFEQCLTRNRLAHAYIFYGQEGRGKEAFAIELAKALNCISDESKPCQECPACLKISHLNHPDIKFIFPISKQSASDKIAGLIKEKAKNPFAPVLISGHKNVPIEAIRELKNEAKYAPYEAEKRVFIISGAEYFSREAANSFLKLLEEPPDNLMIILVTDDINALLDTIQSRCQPIYFPDFKISDIEKIIINATGTKEDIPALIRISQFNIKKVFRLLHSDYKDQRQAIYQLLKAVAAENMLSVSRIVDEITQRRDKNYILESLNLLILWLRDSLHYQVYSTTEDFVNLDFADSIAKFSQFFPGADMEALITCVDEAYWQIERNMHPTLTLTKMTIEMNKYLKSTTPVKEAV